MDRHIFHMRLRCHYKEENAIGELEIDLQEEGAWKPFHLDTLTPGFLVFTYAILTCQHMFLRSNALEKKLLMKHAEGTITIDASPEWIIEKLAIDFNAELRSGTPGGEDIDYISARMQQCPVSKNLGPIKDAQTTLTFA